MARNIRPADVGDTVELVVMSGGRASHAAEGCVLGHEAADGAAGVHGYDRLARYAWPTGSAGRAVMVVIT